jgi:protein-L-isoaspartate(D-aspartate) O-methyltransferase
MDFTSLRKEMVERTIEARGVHDPAVLKAMETVPREALVPHEMVEFAYEDRPLPIGAGQTISQPYIVALMVEALQVDEDDLVLEIGTGSGYGAAVLGQVARHVHTIERHTDLAEVAARRLAELGYANIDVHCTDGTLGWLEAAPYQGIVVTAGGPTVPQQLLEQLAIGGRMVMPLGGQRLQQLVRLTRLGPQRYDREDLGPVQFVPLIGRAGWAEPPAVDGKAWPAVWPPRDGGPLRGPRPLSRPALVSRLIAECAELAPTVDDAALAPLLDRIGSARVVLLGESTHGTSEFYRMRTRITRELILRCGFDAVAIEADWPDAARIDRHLRNAPPRPYAWVPFARFPYWMWRNRETHELIDWLRAYNGEIRDPERQVRFAGLDLYGLYTSASEVVRYLDLVDPELARVARDRYGCLTPWQSDPASYGRAALTGRMPSCERAAVAMLRDLFVRRLELMAEDGEDFFDAMQNARLVAGAERYYRALYYGATESWNMRDQHMFDCLSAFMDHRGPNSRVVVWAHNSHVGDAAATEMGARGEHNLAYLCRLAYGDDVHLVGFGTDRGRVAAVQAWGGDLERMELRPSHPESYERLCRDAGLPGFILALHDPVRDELRAELMEPRLGRAIGVVYRPETELLSHYFQAALPDQFDDYIWFEETSEITPTAPPAMMEQLAAHLPTV